MPYIGYKRPKEVADIPITVESKPGESVQIAGSSRALSELESDDVELLKKDLGTILAKEKSPTVQDIIKRHAPEVLAMVRSVNSESKNGYSGMYASGNELNVNMISPGDVERDGSKLSSFETEYTNDKKKSFLYGEGNEAKVGEQQGIVIFALTDAVEHPKVNRLQLWKNDKKSVESLETFFTEQGYDEDMLPVYELREPIFGFPEETFYIDCNVYTTGTDKLRPIGFVVQRDTDWGLTPSEASISS